MAKLIGDSFEQESVRSVHSRDTVGSHCEDVVKVDGKRLLFKIDLFVLSFVCLQYWINYVDRVAFTNAYISGMQEALQLKGDDFNVTNTCFTVGYILGMLPNNLILLVAPPRIWLSFCAFSWGLLTLGMSRVHTFQQCCVIRFFQALFESCTFSGTHLILGSWYKENELPIRSAIFTSSGLIGSMFSGFMQVKIHNDLDGRYGLAGWRWLFIIDCCITMPIALYGLVFFPGVPEKTGRKSWLSVAQFIFSEQELQLARRRLPVRDESLKLDWSVIPRVLKRWHWWLFSFVWVLGGENLSFASNSTFALWLQKEGYSLAHRNNYPSGIFAVGVVSTVAAAVYLSKYSRARHWHVALVLAVFMCIVAILIRAKPLDPRVMFTAQYLGGIGYAGQAVFFAWANVVCHEDLQERAIVLASMNMFSGAVNAWWSLVFYPATATPCFVNGCYALMATAAASGIVSIAIRKCQVREYDKKQQLPYIDANDMIDDDDNDSDDDGEINVEDEERGIQQLTFE
ncbi:probable Pantothenate transporter FEN2 [Zygosaccharomyces bailii]|nr:probable Pantothenate transporter FEN2 [Zygosaccharomyces bailii]